MRPGNWWGFLKEAIRSWSDDRAARMAAALAFYSIFSMAPFAARRHLGGGLVFGADAARGEIFGQFESHPRHPARAERSRKPSTGPTHAKGRRWASIIGVVLLDRRRQRRLHRAAGLAEHHLEGQARSRPAGCGTLIRTRLLSFSLVVGCGFLLLVSLVVSAALSALHSWIECWGIPGGAIFGHVLHLVLSLVMVTLLFAMIFKVLLPDAKLRLARHLVRRVHHRGAVHPRQVPHRPLSRNGSVASAYGAAGTLVVWLMWVYYSVADRALRGRADEGLCPGRNPGAGEGGGRIGRQGTKPRPGPCRKLSSRFPNRERRRQVACSNARRRGPARFLPELAAVSLGVSRKGRAAPANMSPAGPERGWHTLCSA